MSVICKSGENIQAMTGGLLYHLDSYRDVLTESDIFCRIRAEVGEGENFEVVFIYWLMFRMWIANKVAYAVQYGENVDLCEDIPDVDPVFVDPSELTDELRSLNYNIYTNGGQYWMDHKWHQIFEQITSQIKANAEAVQPGGVQ